MLAGGYSWRLFFYVEAAFAAALLIMAFLFVEESTYHRDNQSTSSHDLFQSLEVKTGEKEKDSPEELEDVLSIGMPPRKSFLSTLAPWNAVDSDAEFFMTMLRSFSYFFVPAVFWVIASYGRYPCTYTNKCFMLTPFSGLYIGLGALAFNYTFPIKIVEPPYNWSEVNPNRPDRINTLLIHSRQIPAS